ncbi:thermonuclease family protein [Mesoaciditoga sp.]
MKKYFLFLTLVGLSLILSLSLSSCLKFNAQNEYKVLKVVDGDTIDVLYNGAEMSVRYIGIDAPETHDFSDKPIGEYGQEAYEFNKNLITKANNRVRLEFDKDMYDRYHRLLAYVYVNVNSTSLMLNADIIKHGLAWPLTYSDTSKHTQEFWKDYRYAYEHRLGLFSKYDDATTVQACVVDKNLSKYIGKLTWVEFHPSTENSSSYSVTLSSSCFSVTVRKPELGEFATPLNVLYLNKDVKVYGEVWKNGNKGEMLLHAPFEFKVVGGGN